MKAVHELGDLQRMALHKNITGDPVKMVKIKALTVDILTFLSTASFLHERLRQDNLRTLAKEIFGEYPPDDISMRLMNITTYQWLFGFKRRSRVYIDCKASSIRKHKSRAPMTVYHVYCLCLTLNKLSIITEISCPILIDQRVSFDPDEIIRFLADIVCKLKAYVNQSLKLDDLAFHKQFVGNVDTQTDSSQSVYAKSQTARDTTSQIQNINNISTSRPIKKSITNDDQVPYLRERSFSELLYWHLFINGTRPDGSPHKPGQPWLLKEFAHAVQRDIRTVNSWLRNHTLPYEIYSVFQVFFGKQAAYETWKADMQFALDNSART